jgi:hypothetical protein
MVTLCQRVVWSEARPSVLSASWNRADLCNLRGHRPIATALRIGQSSPAMLARPQLLIIVLAALVAAVVLITLRSWGAI